jgi:polysaccharide deacetylase 2 family uncharacterized protein YibQ
MGLTPGTQTGYNAQTTTGTGFMGHRRGGFGAKAQIAVATVAVMLGCGMLAWQLIPAKPHRVATLPLSIASGPVLHDPLAGAGAVKRETMAEPSHSVEIVPPPRPAAAVPAFTPPSRAPVPAISAAWRHNAATAGPEDGRPMIAIVIDDMGLDRRHSDEAAGLPAPLTLSFMTYAEELPAQVGAARAHGHEIMLHVPMEPRGAHIDPGPNALTLGLDEDEIRRRMIWDLGRIDGIVGVNNHMGSRFTEWPQGMAPVLAMLRERGLFFLDSRTTPRSVGIELAVGIGLPHAARDIFLDDDPSDPAVAGALAKTEAVARRTGIAIAIGHPHAQTLIELRRWLPAVEARGFRLVPVSAIVRHNETVAGSGG